MISTNIHTVESIRHLLSGVNDPEIPAINILELGIIRDIEMLNDHVTVTITPTYSGCPAMKMIEDDIRRVLGENGIRSVSISTIFSPAWTTDWIDENTKIKLREYGIAPPAAVTASPLLQIELPSIPCPYCQSGKTQLKSEFGSTPCKSYYLCHSCLQPFEYFKSF